jgi:hypothetical protein
MILTKDCTVRCGWAERTITAFWLDWIKNPDEVRGGKAGRAAQLVRAKELEQQKLVQKIVERVPYV